MLLAQVMGFDVGCNFKCCFNQAVHSVLSVDLPEAAILHHDYEEKYWCDAPAAMLSVSVVQVSQCWYQLPQPIAETSGK